MRGRIPAHWAKVGLAATVTALIATAPAAAESNSTSDSKTVPGQLIVRFAGYASNSDERSAVNQSDAKIQERIGSNLVDAAVVKVDNGVDVAQAAKELEQTDAVISAEPNYVIHALDTPNDPMFTDMWSLFNDGVNGSKTGADINAVSAWDQSHGSCNIVVAITDTGIDASHPDLASNVWVNPDEIPNNGIDDDDDGFIDDVHGADFVNGDGNPNDDHGHGSHVAGTIGATGNNGIGVTGVSQRVKLMGLKFLDSDGFGTTSDAIKAIDYAHQHGANVINASWGGGGYESALFEAIKRSGITFVAAAGNSGENSDVNPQFPANFNLPNVISVAASTSSDTLASYSNYGAYQVDVAAPGSNILSTVPGGYATFSGTSMATPQVSGTAALMLSTASADPASIRAAIMNSADKKLAFQGMVASGGRLNVAAALQVLGGGNGPDPTAECDGTVTPSPKKATPVNGSVIIKLLTPRNNSKFHTKKGKHRRRIVFKWSQKVSTENVRNYQVVVNGKVVKAVRDSDGPGGQSPVHSASVLMKAGKQYYAYIVAVDYEGNRSTSLSKKLKRSSGKERQGQHFTVVRG